MKRNILFIILLISMISIASSLGVTPARTTIDFKPGLQKTIEVQVIGSGEEKQLGISVSGELAPYITPSTKKVVLSNSNTKTVSYDINLPSTLEPGLHTGEVIIIEETKNNDDNIVQATLAVKTQLHVYVPIPGKYAESDVFITEPTSEITRFAIPVVSAGTYNLASVRANVDIYNKLGEKVHTFNTQTISVESGSKKDLVYDWNRNVTVGDYLAIVNLIYDGETKRMEKPFKIGNKLLELQEIRADNFQLGGIAKFEMLVENKWNQDITDVYIDTKIFDQQKQILANFKSPVETITALTKQVFTAYWDTAGFTEGTYNTQVAINYGNESVSRSLQFEITENKLTVIGLGYVISSGGDAQGQSNLVVILLGAVIILILINLLWFLLLRKKLKKK